MGVQAQQLAPNVVACAGKQMDARTVSTSTSSNATIAAKCYAATAKMCAKNLHSGMVALMLCTLERALKKNSEINAAADGCVPGCVWTTRRHGLGHDCRMARGVLVGVCYSKTGPGHKGIEHYIA